MTQEIQRKPSLIEKIVRAPLLFVRLLIGLVALILVAAIATSGQLWETILRLFGAKFRVQWPLIPLGIITYFVLFLGLPIILGHLALGWPGAVSFPIGTLVVMAIIDRW